MGDLPVAAVERLIRKAGAERVSITAAKALADILEEKAKEIGERAYKLAKHSGRKTVTEEDVKLAKE